MTFGDSLRLSFGWSRETRMRGLLGVMSSVFGQQGTSVTHPAVDPAKVPFGTYSFSKAARSSAIYTTVGLGELRGFELICEVKNIERDPMNDKYSWLLSAVGCYEDPFDLFHTLPPGPSPPLAIGPPSALGSALPLCEQAFHTRLLSLVPLSTPEYERATSLPDASALLSELTTAGANLGADRIEWSPQLSANGEADASTIDKSS